MKRRTAVRVVVSDLDGALLLFRDSDPGAPGSAWWMTPGGGIDPGESAREAAVREVREETGLVIAAGDLVGPVARRASVHGYSDLVTVQHEDFYLLTVPRFDVVTTGHTDDEQLTVTGHAWLSDEDLAREQVPVWPADVVSLRALSGEVVVELGAIEESTVPLRLGCQDPDAVRRWSTA